MATGAQWGELRCICSQSPSPTVPGTIAIHPSIHPVSQCCSCPCGCGPEVVMLVACPNTTSVWQMADKPVPAQDVHTGQPSLTPLSPRPSPLSSKTLQSHRMHTHTRGSATPCFVTPHRRYRNLQYTQCFYVQPVRGGSNWAAAQGKGERGKGGTPAKHHRHATHWPDWSGARARARESGESGRSSCIRMSPPPVPEGGVETRDT